MKNKSIFKAAGIMIALTILLTWVVPSSQVGQDGITMGSIMPTGFADIFTSLEVISQYFIKPSIFIIFVGMFYGVANRTGAFKKVVDKIVSLTKKRKFIFLILTILFYAVTTALTGMYIQLFMFIPLSIAVLTKLKYNKVQAVLATVGASTIGLIGEISNSIIKQVGSITDNTYIWIKLGLLVILVLLTILYAIKINAKKEKVENTEEEVKEVPIMFIPEKRNATIEANVKGIAFIIVLSLIFVVFVLGFTPWSNNEIFKKAYLGLQEVKIGEFAIFDSILGNFEVFGTWTYNSVYPTMAIAILVLTLIDSLKFKEMVEACVEGAKKVAGLAILAGLITLAVIFTLNSGFLGTIINYLTKGSNIALMSLSSLIAAPFLVEMGYMAQYNLSMMLYATANTSVAEIWGLITQVTYGFVMLIAPTSVLLMVTLGYVEESYTKWFKYIWKFLAAVLILCIAAILVASVL